MNAAPAPAALAVRRGAVTLRGELLPGRPAVLLLPGGGQTRASWSRTARSLARAGIGAVTFDMRGHGQSDHAPDGDYTADALIADLLACCRALAEPPVLVGASLSGLTALLAAGEQPGCARGLVLVDMAIDTQRGGMDRVLGFLGGSRDGFDSLERFAEAVAGYTGTPPAPAERMRRHARRGTDGRWYWHWDPVFLERPPQFPRDRLVAAAARVTVPTLLVRGQASDVVSREDAEATRALLPRARLLDVADAGHMITGGDNDIFATGLADFITTT